MRRGDLKATGLRSIKPGNMAWVLRSACRVPPVLIRKRILGVYFIEVPTRLAPTVGRYLRKWGGPPKNI